MEMHPPLSYYVSNDLRSLRFHLIDTGEGLMFLLILPDENETTLLYDCNLICSSKERIINYLSNNLPFRYDAEADEFTQTIDIFVNSHRDNDHLRGLSDVNKSFRIRSIWDSGQTGAATEGDDYLYYMQLRRQLIAQCGENAVIVPEASITPLYAKGGVNIYCLNSSLDYQATKSFMTFSAYDAIKSSIFSEPRIQHTNCIVLSIHYAGRSILLTGDSDWLAWRDKIIPNFGSSGLVKSNILLASHHGSRSFFTDENLNEDINPNRSPDTTYVESIDFISPSMTLISCGDYDSAHHPNESAMEIYETKTIEKQVYTTCEKGTLSGFIDSNGIWTVVPERFSPLTSKGLSFTIECSYKKDGKIQYVNSGDSVPVDTQIIFVAYGKGGIFDPFSEVDFTWEVSNGGINSDHDKQQIYYWRKNERAVKNQFMRFVRYEGRHLLRCKVHNKKKNISITRIFIVNGVK